jgi:nicotinamidase-related amidase
MVTIMGRSIPARPHDFPLDIAHTALLVIDMQYDFLDPDGGCPQLLQVEPETLAAVRGIIPRVANLLDWARQHCFVVAYTREASRPDLSDLSDSKRLRYQNAGYPVGTLGKMGRLLVQGEPGCAIIDELAPNPGDLQYDKPGQSAFVGTHLEADLRAWNISHLLLCGVTTQCCVLATYRHAADLGFFPLLLEDCCAAFDPREHEAAVAVVTSEGGAVGWVTSSEYLWRNE